MHYDLCVKHYDKDWNLLEVDESHGSYMTLQAAVDRADSLQRDPEGGAIQEACVELRGDDGGFIGPSYERLIP